MAWLHESKLHQVDSPPRMKTVFFSVGEPSGDLHGANFIRSLRQLRADVRCVGYGGPRMQAAGCELHEDLTRFAVMWIAKVIAKLPTFLRLLGRANRFFREQQPDAVVLIDYPGFNWWIADVPRRTGFPCFTMALLSSGPGPGGAWARCGD